MNSWLRLAYKGPLICGLGARLAFLKGPVKPTRLCSYSEESIEFEGIDIDALLVLVDEPRFPDSSRPSDCRYAAGSIGISSLSEASISQIIPASKIFSS